MARKISPDWNPDVRVLLVPCFEPEVSPESFPRIWKICQTHLINPFRHHLFYLIRHLLRKIEIKRLDVEGFLNLALYSHRLRNDFPWRSFEENQVWEENHRVLDKSFQPEDVDRINRIIAMDAGPPNYIPCIPFCICLNYDPALPSGGYNPVKTGYRTASPRVDTPDLQRLITQVLNTECVLNDLTLPNLTKVEDPVFNNHLWPCFRLSCAIGKENNGNGKQNLPHGFLAPFICSSQSRRILQRKNHIFQAKFSIAAHFGRQIDPSRFQSGQHLQNHDGIRQPQVASVSDSAAVRISLIRIEDRRTSYPLRCRTYPYFIQIPANSPRIFVSLLFSPGLRPFPQRPLSPSAG